MWHEGVDRKGNLTCWEVSWVLVQFSRATWLVPGKAWNQLEPRDRRRTSLRCNVDTQIAIALSANGGPHGGDVTGISNASLPQMNYREEAEN